MTATPNSPHGFLGANEDEASRFTVTWKKEIIFILRAVMEKTELVTAHFNQGQDFILTSIIQVDANRDLVFLDLGANEAQNQKILGSGKVIFVTAHDKVKVQFVSDKVEKALYGGRDVLKIALPKSLINLQRREFYRVTTPIAHPLKCIILMGDKSKVTVTVVDISIGGIGVVLPPEGVEVEPGMKFRECYIALPEIGELLAELEIRNVFEIVLKNGSKTKRAGCRFTNLSAHMQSMIQRYIIKVERERRAMEPDRQ